MVLENLAGEWPKAHNLNHRIKIRPSAFRLGKSNSKYKMFQEENGKRPNSDIDKYVWSNHKPWVPRPLLSMHVRMGDKACEMRVVEFEEYIQLADRIRSHFPNLNSIWLSTEMQ
ncbi:coatomer protein, partial [Trifolium medium]|nr:coatomer protein [Trifolium medium]